MPLLRFVMMFTGQKHLLTVHNCTFELFSSVPALDYLWFLLGTGMDHRDVSAQFYTRMPVLKKLQSRSHAHSLNFSFSCLHDWGSKW